ncbi:hypothetical protein B0T18DRAFT_422014 [Schizothecium vesticola]|uniref:Ig-like domain-containing protein n=1 Tax=Schizothecium vesticola TaxID=314040 RepID=A0AA40BQC2_9PEZI|nr:hypothetical protein B0T18DRAFT_422014 [Schizothecium vesticola]
MTEFAGMLSPLMLLIPLCFLTPETEHSPHSDHPPQAQQCNKSSDHIPHSPPPSRLLPMSTSERGFIVPAGTPRAQITPDNEQLTSLLPNTPTRRFPRYTHLSRPFISFLCFPDTRVYAHRRLPIPSTSPVGEHAQSQSSTKKSGIGTYLTIQCSLSPHTHIDVVKVTFTQSLSPPPAHV